MADLNPHSPAAEDCRPASAAPAGNTAGEAHRNGTPDGRAPEAETHATGAAPAADEHDDRSGLDRAEAIVDGVAARASVLVMDWGRKLLRFTSLSAVAGLVHAAGRDRLVPAPAQPPGLAVPFARGLGRHRGQRRRRRPDQPAGLRAGRLRRDAGGSNRATSVSDGRNGGTVAHASGSEPRRCLGPARALESLGATATGVLAAVFNSEAFHVQQPRPPQRPFP